MRGVQDRRRHEAAIDAAVRDGEGPALHFRHAELAVAGAGAKFGDLLLDRGKAHLVGIAHHRHDKARRRADGHAHMNEVLVDHVAAVDLGIDLGHFLQRVAAGLHEEGHEAQLDLVLLLEGVLVFVAQVHDALHVHLVIGGQHRGGVLRVLEAAGDGGAQPRHLHPLFPRRVLGRDRCAGGRGRGGRGRSHGRGGGGRGGGGLGDVFLHHPPVAAGAGDLIGGQALFRHRLLGRRRVFHILAFGQRFGSGAGGIDLFGLDAFLRGSRGARGAFGHDGKAGLGIDRAALGRDDLGQHTGDGRGDLDGDLVRLKLTQHLVHGDRVARLLEPGGDGRLGHAFAQRGHHHVDILASHLALIGLRRGNGAFLGGCIFGTGFPGLGNLREQCVHADGRAFGGDDLGQLAGDGGRDLDRHLVGLKLAQHLIHGDGVAWFLEPGGDRRLGHAFAQRGDANLDCHQAPPPTPSASATSASCSALWRLARPVAGDAVADRPA